MKKPLKGIFLTLPASAMKWLIAIVVFVVVLIILVVKALGGNLSIMGIIFLSIFPLTALTAILISRRPAGGYTGVVKGKKWLIIALIAIVALWLIIWWLGPLVAKAFSGLIPVFSYAVPALIIIACLVVLLLVLARRQSALPAATTTPTTGTTAAAPTAAVPLQIGWLVALILWVLFHVGFVMAFSSLSRTIWLQHQGLLFGFEMMVIISILAGLAPQAKKVRVLAILLAVLIVFIGMGRLIFSKPPAVSYTTISSTDIQGFKTVETFVDTVYASNPDWTKSKVTLQAGDVLVYEATGSIIWDPSVSQYASGPNGYTRKANKVPVSEHFPVPNYYIGGLVGRAKYDLFSEERFGAGSHGGFRAIKPLEIYWGVNDRGLGKPELAYCFGDNSGIIVITSKVYRF